MTPVGPVFTSHLYGPLHIELLALLRGLDEIDWDRPTVCREWTVRDIAAHMLDTQVRVLSGNRGRLAPDVEIDSYQTLVGWLNRVNAEWVTAMRRASPQVLIGFLAITGPQVADHVSSLDPHGPARFLVAWAGDTTSPNWFDIGRNYTEYWHHQQQIRDAVDAPPLTGRQWLHPVLAIFLRALPHTYRHHPGAIVQVTIEGAAGGEWTLRRGQLFDGAEPNPDARVLLSDDTAWRLFTHGLSHTEARSRIAIEGDADLAAVFLSTLAVMA